MDNSIQILVGPGAMALIGAGGTALLKQDTIGELIEFLIALKDVAEREPDCEPDDDCEEETDLGIEDERHDDDDPAEDDDPLEANGDEQDGNPAEDEFMHHYGSGPGCIISDPDKAVDDDNCDEPFQDLEYEDGF